ncbi:dual specificity protein kinase yak1 [Coemansia sp. RSA 2522]|nr:dual specificity protein kinase yak1 [Coemansia sp. RSA 2522]
MQRLQMEQERLQQEQMRLALEQQQQLKIAQEQELLRFRNYRPLLNLTVDIVETYRKCHPEFYYESARRPRRVLTHPSDGVKNDGFDNANSDYILYVSDVIGEKEGHQYLILEMLGSGTFGQVVKCQNLKTGDLVAVKVIKNKTAYYNQSMMEVQMLDLLNKKYDVDDRHHILRLKEWFVFRNHLVFVNELLSINLYDLLKQNQYQGLSTNLVRVLVQQILDAMIVMNKAQIIHADLKPENILLEGMEKPVIKIIDFGSACFEWQTTFTYIQSRFYRSPEILLGLPYSSRIDMWSLGCIVAELYLGLPLFPGSSEYNQLSRIVDLLGTPPRNMLEKARRTDEFFNYLGPSTWDFKPMDQFSRERNTEEKESKRYFSATTLEELITTYPIRRRVSEAEQQREYQSRVALIDFLRGLLQLDPGRRWSPLQASMHPFITGEPYVGPFVPSHNLHDSSGAPGPYGPAPSGSGYSSGSAYHTPQGGDGYGQSHTVGYSAAHYAGGQGSNGYTGHTSYARDTGASLFSHPPSPAAASSGLPDTSNMTWAHRTNRQQDSNGSSLHTTASNILSIPGSFPVNNSSGGQSHQSSYAGSQSSRPDGRGRLRATTLGHTGGLEHLSRISAENTYDHSYQQHQELTGSFLGVDPSTSHMRESLAVDSEPRDAPGRLNISQSNSDYSVDNASHDWASRSETNYNSNYPSSNTGSNGTRAGSLYEYKGAGLSASRQYLVNERQQQRLLQQRQLYQNDSGPLPSAEHRSGGVADAGSSTGVRLEKLPDYGMSPGSELRYDALGTSPALPPSAMPALGQNMHNAPPSRPDLYGHTMRLKPSPALRSHAGARLVSNFSPLTLPSTPGSSGHSHRYASTANDDRFSAEPEMAQQFIDIVTSYDECDDVDDDSNVDSASSSDGQGSSRFSEGSGMSRPLTQARGSETSLSLYSAASERDDATSHDRGTDRTGFTLLSDSDMHSDGSDDPEYAEALTSIYSMHSDDRWQKFPIPRTRQQHGAGPAKHSSLPYALDHPLAEAQGSIYMLPRYAACSQDVLDSAGLVFSAQHRISAVLTGNSDAKENMQPVSGSEDRDWDLEDGFSLADGVDSGSVISQDIASGPESPLTDQDDIDEASGSFIRLDVSQSSPGLDDQSSVLFGSIDRYSESSEESDVDSGTRVNQDTVLYVGRPHPLQGLASASTFSKEYLLGPPQLRQSVQDLASLGDRVRPSLDSLHVSPLPVPQSIRCAVAATYPQKIMKWSQHTRSDRPLQSKDSMRMVESLRRMGKWQDSESVQAADELRRANQFFYDPVIIAMSPRLMPQSGQPS